ncbi:MAG: LysR family transcriptional regulator [Tissierellia bacterium]|nr:LysR family transcriptional regulator [Tissierellia bacterium]
MNIEFIKTFITLSNTGSFTKTANDEYISQSTVSNRIKEMEKRMNCKLFNRDSGRAMLTESGKMFLPYAERMLELEKEAMNRLKINKRGSKKLMIGSVHSFFDNYLSPNLKSLINFDKELVNIRLDHSREVINFMVAGKRSLGFTHHPCNYSDFVSEYLFSEKLKLVTGKFDEKLNRGINVSMLRELKFFNSSFLDRHIEELMLDKVQFSLVINIGSGTVDLIKGTNYLTLLPEGYADPELERGNFFEVPINDYEFPKVEYYCIRHKDKQKLNDTELKIIEFFKNLRDE